MSETTEAPLKLAVCTQSVSHFEAPLFRLTAQLAGLQLKVFYIDEISSAQRFDADYRQHIEWGGDLLAGYDSAHCADSRDLQARAVSWGADVVMMYGYTWPGAARMILSRWLRRKPQIHRGTLSDRPNPSARLRNAMARPIGRWLLGRFDAHHFGGACSRKVLLAAGATPESLFFVPYSVDSPYFLAQACAEKNVTAAAAIRAAAGWSAEDRVLLLICQHSWAKGTDIAMEVFRRYRKTDPSARFLIVGSGVKTPAMKAFAREHGLGESVHFAGFVPSAKTVPFYLTSDLVLCTSRYETWARMINEAMLCGRPCIVNEFVAAAGDLVRDGDTGFVVEGLDPDVYVNAIARYFALDAESKRTMAEVARGVAMEFSYERNIQHVAEAARYAVDRRCR